MRVAILADIHGNLFALEAALAEVERLKVDHIVIAGDIVVGSPDSLACWNRVKSLRCPVLRGNHERYVFDLDSERAGAEWRTERFGPVRFAAQQLGETNRQELSLLPTQWKLAEFPELLFVHGSARNDNDLVFPYTSDAELEPMFARTSERWILRGHNHFAGARLWNDRYIVTVGSVGLPLDGTPSAQFTLLEKRNRSTEWSVVHRSVPYDILAATRRFEDSGYLDTAGPMARLFQREVLTAAFHIVPFLKFYHAAKASTPDLSLTAAVDRFCPR